MKWVHWEVWDELGIAECGQMPQKNVLPWIQKFELRAKEVLDSTGADHVVYAAKHYDKEGELAEVRFYMIPMTDAQFEERAVGTEDAVVYALHRRK